LYRVFSAFERQAQRVRRVLAVDEPQEARRFGAYCDYLRPLAERRDARASAGAWFSCDLTESLNLFTESAVKSYDKNNLSLMLRFYL
jgi:hypothetical protein